MTNKIILFRLCLPSNFLTFEDQIHSIFTHPFTYPLTYPLPTPPYMAIFVKELTHSYGPK